MRHKNADLRVLCDLDLKSEAYSFLEAIYDELESFCRKDPLFLLSYEPMQVSDDAPSAAKKMARAAEKAGVGPMAAVAGTFAQALAEHLLERGASDVVVENGGDIYLKLVSDRTVGIYSGGSEFSEKLGFRVRADETPLAICTSSSSVGHSISLGDSDSVSAVARDASIADAAATAIGNMVKGPLGLEKGTDKAKGIEGLRGALIIRGGELASFGVLPELVRL